MSAPTPHVAEAQALQRLYADDCDRGALALWLPGDCVDALLRARGWSPQIGREGEPTGSWLSPNGGLYHERDEALRVALLAETLSEPERFPGSLHGLGA